MNSQPDSMRFSAERSSRREFLAWNGKLAVGSALGALAAQSHAAEGAKGATSAAQKPAGNDFGPPIWPPFDKVEAVLQHWSRQHPDRMRLEAAGRSAQGRTLYVVRLTDAKTDDTDKEHALITALHSGLERSGSNTVLAIIEWLLSDDAGAREILRRQIVVCLPLPDPDRYVAGHVSPLYGAWTLDGPLNPERSPEAMVVKTVMDQYQPEVHADIHGVNMDFARYIMFENSGASYSNLALRPYHRDIMRQMDEAALAEGYPSDTGEDDAERIYAGPNLDAMRGKLWLGQPRVYAAVYCYHHYHTMVSASEVLWEQSGLLRHRRLLEIGNETWPGELHRGYPTRVVMANTHAALTAYGQTAAARRRSRVELWNKLPQLSLALLDPVVEGKAVGLCATSTAAAKRWLRDAPLKESLNAWRSYPGLDVQAVARFLEGWPGSQNAPVAMVCPQGGGTAGAGQEQPIQNGLCLRLRLPYRLAKLQEIRLNGHPLAPSDTEGFTTWTARACTYIQVNLSPSRLHKEDLFVVTCQYDPGEKRGHWDTWRNLKPT